VILLSICMHQPGIKIDVKNSFYGELGCVFNQFLKYCVNIFVEDFNEKVGREDTFKPTTGNESLHEITNDNRVRVVKFPT